jgi:hypothetical protein
LPVHALVGNEGGSGIFREYHSTILNRHPGLRAFAKGMGAGRAEDENPVFSLKKQCAAAEAAAL